MTSPSDFEAARARVSARFSQPSSPPETQHASSAAAASPLLPYPLGPLGDRARTFWERIRGAEGTRPAFRVGQVDAELLDEELLELLRGQVGEGVKYLNASMKEEWAPEIQLVLRAILFKLSIWDNNASYGAALQGLQYTDARAESAVLSPPTKWQKALYGVVGVGGRYGWAKWEDYLLSRPERETSKRVRLLSRFSSLGTSAYTLASFVSFLVFLVNGRYRTLLDRFLRIRLAPPTGYQRSRQVSFEYLNRQLVWHAFTEFLLFLLPLVGIRRWRRWVGRAWVKVRKVVGGEGDGEKGKKGEFAFLPERTCAVCYKEQNALKVDGEGGGGVAAVAGGGGGGGGGGVVGSVETDITNPYETVPCRCLYCYVCIATKLEEEEGEGWPCLRCGELVKECKPWNGDVVEEVFDEGYDEGVDTGSITPEEVANHATKAKEEAAQHEASDSGVDITSGG